MTATPAVRPAAVAGAFYPAEHDVLEAALADSFAAAVPAPDGPRPRALVVPHAGYGYSGPVAATAYRCLVPWSAGIRRVALLGPSHRIPLRGLATSGAEAWDGPLGLVPLDRDAAADLEALPQVHRDDLAHAPEHSLEVQVPFLQSVLDRVTLLPLLVGDATPEEVAEVIEVLWRDESTVVVVSTDLSHYLPQEQAVRLDARTAAAIEAVRPEAIGDHDACGARPLRGLLVAAARAGRRVRRTDLRTSGDTSGDTRRVVGYGSFVIT